MSIYNDRDTYELKDPLSQAEAGVLDDSMHEDYAALYGGVRLGQWKWWRWDYLFDWGVIICLALLELCLAHLVFEPFKRYEPPNDPSTAYPHMEDTVRVFPSVP